MASCDGHYQKQTGRQFEYIYHAVWSHTGAYLVFEGSVVRESMEIARPRGQICCSAENSEYLVRCAIETAIESSVIE